MCGREATGRHRAGWLLGNPAVFVCSMSWGCCPADSAGGAACSVGQSAARLFAPAHRAPAAGRRAWPYVLVPAAVVVYYVGPASGRTEPERGVQHMPAVVVSLQHARRDSLVIGSRTAHARQSHLHISAAARKFLVSAGAGPCNLLHTDCLEHGTVPVLWCTWESCLDWYM